mmetsp:Transcript_30753/g.46878  ORF Transcript_30753/g.46878 Transcript_30753/m.46878 type:complete len:461 (-) Transcript_30753:8-1390(-)
MIEELTSTTAPGKIFNSRSELAEHYKSDWHKYNLKRREAGLPLLQKEDFEARLDAALALRREREVREERTGKDHLKKGKKKKKEKITKIDGAVTVSQVPHYDQMKIEEKEGNSHDDDEKSAPPNESEAASEEAVEEIPIIEPRQCLFDKYTSPTLEANIERMHRKYGFFVPDQEYLVDKEGFLGYCHEKIKLGHCCLYCQKIFRTWQGCQKHMISTRHTKLRYEHGIDLDEFDPFYDFSEADAEFLGTLMTNSHKSEADQDINMEENDDIEWEDVTDDDETEMEIACDDTSEDGEEEGLYAGYKDEIARLGFDVTPLGELVFPDGRIVGHRGLSRYYKQRATPSNERAAVVAARRAAGDILYRGRIYNVDKSEDEHQSSLAVARAGVISSTCRSGKGVLVSSGNGYTALSLYRYKAVVKKARRDDARGLRQEYKTTRNINKMDKKANRIMNGVSVAHAAR